MHGTDRIHIQHFNTLLQQENAVLDEIYLVLGTIKRVSPSEFRRISITSNLPNCTESAPFKNISKYYFFPIQQTRLSSLATQLMSYCRNCTK
uniref:Uncharacterized protein n=1 Tax=Lepeophtheirus salmonis TaxID=72036 RepID=A0A0K2TB77_LEPSM